jgi:Glycosyl transferase family 41
MSEPGQFRQLALRFTGSVTLPVNGHTTTSDALWAGTPVLTCAGQTFVSRVAGSLLHAAGLTELVTTSLEEYEAVATTRVTIRHQPRSMRQSRTHLERSRRRVPAGVVHLRIGGAGQRHQPLPGRGHGDRRTDETLAAP